MSARPLLLGHRGARIVKSIPENTPASFDRALADGCDGFEFDVRMTGDARAVICHDAKIGGVEIKCVPADHLRRLPELDEIVQLYEHRAFLDIELKVVGLEKTVVELLRQHRPRRGFVVSSFLPEVIRSLRAEDPAMPLGLICETKAQLEGWRELPIKYVIARDKLVGRDLMSEVDREARKLLVWTVNNRRDMRRFVDWGVAGIISDDTKLLCETLAH